MQCAFRLERGLGVGAGLLNSHFGFLTDPGGLGLCVGDALSSISAKLLLVFAVRSIGGGSGFFEAFRLRERGFRFGSGPSQVDGETRDDREIDPGRGTSGFASQSASRALLRRAQQLHWVVTISYPDAGVAMATMDGWEDALADLDTTVARVPDDAAIALRLRVVCSTEEAAIATATKRAGEVTGLVAKQVIAASAEA